jgi:hypothetical protein
VCQLPAIPVPTAASAPTATAAAAAGALDVTSPGSRVAFPLAGKAYLRISALRGLAGPDRSDVAGVQVALAQRVGTQCRFRAASGGWTAPRACAQQLYVAARAVGGNWLLSLRRPLRPGLYRVWSRATDGAGNREAVGIAGVNTLQFRVRAGEA